MKFVKMHGLGNDFIVVEDLHGKITDASAKAKRLCARHFSVGADGLVLIQPSATGDFRMRVFNPDGSEPEMCGNALRCVALYASRYLGSGNKVLFETGGGIKEAVITGAHQVRVNMGKPELSSELIPVAGPRREIINEAITAGGYCFNFAAVSMGNPHCVIYRENNENGFNVDDELLIRVGPLLEKHEMFPNHTNVEFARLIAPGRVEVKVWERGAGVTMACGTGACAVTVAGVLQQRLATMPVEIILPGGSLFIDWQLGNDVFMEGPAVEVFSGEIKQE